MRQENVRIAADSTMLRIVNRLIALSFGVHLEQLEHLMGLTWPRPFLLRPLKLVSYDLDSRLITIRGMGFDQLRSAFFDHFAKL